MKRFCCGECSGSFTQSGSLDVHVRSVHEKKRPFRCMECSSRFAHKHVLARHVLNVHEKQKPFSCVECARGFGRADLLAVHAKRHAKAKQRTSARLCPSKTSPSTVVTKHAATDHVKEEPLVEDDDNLLYDVTETPQVKKETNVDAPGDGTPEEPNMPTGSNDTSKLVLRLRSTVKFKTSSGRVLAVKDQPVMLTFGDFRQLFRVPSDTEKLYAFKSRDEQGSPDKWIVAVDDAMKLPLIDGVIEAEACTESVTTLIYTSHIVFYLFRGLFRRNTHYPL